MLFYDLVTHLLLSSWLAAHLRRANISLYFPFCSAHNVSSTNQSCLMNIRRLQDVTTLKEKEHKFCIIAHVGNVN